MSRVLRVPREGTEFALIAIQTGDSSAQCCGRHRSIDRFGQTHLDAESTSAHSGKVHHPMVPESAVIVRRPCFLNSIFSVCDCFRS
jgi:hypothetical protein